MPVGSVITAGFLGSSNLLITVGYLGGSVVPPATDEPGCLRVYSRAPSVTTSVDSASVTTSVVGPSVRCYVKPCCSAED